MNLILEGTDQVKFFTNIKEVFSALNISCHDYDWFVSDIETNDLVISEGWHSGFELEKTITSNDVQFIWAVFSAFPIGTRFAVAEPPYVDGNPNYWNASEPKPQLEKAIFEIACWDSSATILIGINPAMAENFKSIYTDTIELKYAAR
ncbi:hypothetical protein ACJJIP_08505 [Microbulbifer sp. VTAC004]|uniref:hypothetical protein n=1 Tax=Microbulbifer sp. VTAC004 TaxID=3243386 RepID=UPI004039D658